MSSAPPPSEPCLCHACATPVPPKFLSPGGRNLGKPTYCSPLKARRCPWAGRGPWEGVTQHTLESGRGQEGGARQVTSHSHGCSAHWHTSQLTVPCFGPAVCSPCPLRVSWTGQKQLTQEGRLCALCGASRCWGPEEERVPPSRVVPLAGDTTNRASGDRVAWLLCPLPSPSVPQTGVAQPNQPARLCSSTWGQPELRTLRHRWAPPSSPLVQASSPPAGPRRPGPGRLQQPLRHYHRGSPGL